MQVNYNDVDILVGIVSFGADAGCEMKYPTVFTFIPPYYNWIAQKLNENLK